MSAMAALQHEIHKKNPFEEPAVEAVLSIIRTADLIQRQTEALLTQHDLTVVQYNVLRILRGAGPDGLPCGQIAQQMITRDPDITRLLDRMEKRNLIRRQRDATDRRVVRAYIVDAASDLATQLEQPLIDMHRQQLGELEPNQIQSLIKILEIVRLPACRSEGPNNPAQTPAP